jgi:peptidylprolyl isomerase
MKALSWRTAAFAAVLGLASGCGGDSDGEKKVTPSGVRYIDLVEGEGEPAKFGDGLHFTYTGWLADGKQFERRDREHVASMRLGWGQPIVGLDEGMDGMKRGGKRKIWVPAKAGYGVRGSPPQVPPNSDLVFEVELLLLVTPEKAAELTDDAKKRMSEDEKKLRAEFIAQQTKPPTGKDVPEAERKEFATVSGVKYVDERIGDGRDAVAGCYVDVLYVGRLTNGSKFDSRLTKESPFVFMLGAGKVIKGWDEGLLGMKVGGKRRLVIPPEMGYGKTGAGDKIPPNSTLIFDVELLRVR